MKGLNLSLAICLVLGATTAIADDPNPQTAPSQTSAGTAGTGTSAEAVKYKCSITADGTKKMTADQKNETKQVKDFLKQAQSLSDASSKAIPFITSLCDGDKACKNIKFTCKKDTSKAVK